MKKRESPKSKPNGNGGKTPGGRPRSSGKCTSVYFPEADIAEVRAILEAKPPEVSQGHVAAGIILAYGEQWIRERYGKAAAKP